MNYDARAIKDRSKRVRIPFVAAVALFSNLATGAADVPLRTAVLFNTACAQCHEGECSGRLSFDLGQQAAADHVRRYVGEVAAAVQRDLQALLADMKRSCAYSPLAVAVPENGIWRADDLAQLRSPLGAAHFIPLGVLVAGNYRAALRFDGAAEARAEVISAAFDITDHPGLRAESGGTDFVFAVERKGVHYFRLQTEKPAALIELRITPLP